jgi:hypothetical protein
VVATVKEFVDRIKRNAANRTKEGRVLSDANRKKVQAAADALQELLDQSTPEKQSGGTSLKLMSLELEALTADLID